MGQRHEVWKESLPEAMIRRVMQMYRKATWLQLIEERPEIGLADQMHKQQKREFKFQGPPQGAVQEPGVGADASSILGTGAAMAGSGSCRS